MKAEQLCRIVAPIIMRIFLWHAHITTHPLIKLSENHSECFMAGEIWIWFFHIGTKCWVHRNLLFLTNQTCQEYMSKAASFRGRPWGFLFVPTKAQTDRLRSAEAKPLLQINGSTSEDRVQKEELDFVDATATKSTPFLPNPSSNPFLLPPHSNHHPAWQAFENLSDLQVRSVSCFHFWMKCSQTGAG